MKTGLMAIGARRGGGDGYWDRSNITLYPHKPDRVKGDLLAARLVAGKWITVKADLMPGSKDWKTTKVDEEFRSSIRKVGIRVESDKKPAYSGAFYIDNVRVIILK